MSEYPDKESKEKITPAGWSHTCFSFLTTLSVALVISYLTGPVAHNFRIILYVLASTVPFSAFHFVISRKNILPSQVSLFWFEIILYLLYVTSSALAVLLSSAEFMIASSAAGIILIVMTDMNYSPSGKRIYTYIHSGQNLLTALIIASFLSGLKAPFIFIAVIKFISNIYNAYSVESQNVYFSLRILRIALLMAAGISLATEISYSDPVVTFMFLTGEMLDRIIYYYDMETKIG